MPRAVAVKVVRRQWAEHSGFRARFELEVAAARMVHSRFTAPVVDADPRATEPWMATLYVPGVSLATQVEHDGPLGDEDVRQLGAALATALSDIHRAGVIHRDLKPGNVLMTADGPLVIDFGIARAVDGNPLTTTGEIVGTPAFMAPEQFLPSAEVSPAADVFSLGCLLAYAAIGRSPFDAGSPHATAYQIVHEQPRLDDVPAWLLPLVTMCMAKEPGDRPTPAGLLEAFTSTSPAATATPHTRGQLRQALRGKPARRVLTWAVLAGLLTASFLTGATLQEPHCRTQRPAAPPPIPDESHDLSLYRDTQAGFQLSLPDDLDPVGSTPDGQVWFANGGDVKMIISPGLDTVDDVGGDLLEYQREEEPELQDFRKATSSSVFGVEKLMINRQRAVTGEFRWRDEEKIEYFARNLVMLQDGEYHVILVRGPKQDAAVVSQFFEKAAGSYRVTRQRESLRHGLESQQAG